jgi:hypothetical protein
VATSLVTETPAPVNETPAPEAVTTEADAKTMPEPEADGDQVSLVSTSLNSSSLALIS